MTWGGVGRGGCVVWGVFTGHYTSNPCCHILTLRYYSCFWGISNLKIQIKKFTKIIRKIKISKKNTLSLPCKWDQLFSPETRYEPALLPAGTYRSSVLSSGFSLREVRVSGGLVSGPRSTRQQPHSSDNIAIKQFGQSCRIGAINQTIQRQ